MRLSVGRTRARRVGVENHGRAVFAGWSLLGGSENRKKSGSSQRS